jgi:NADH-quinone oxidoreductase subunit C/D
MMRSLVVDQQLRTEMGVAAAPQTVCDEVPTFWVSKERLRRRISARSQTICWFTAAVELPSDVSTSIQ